MSESSKQQCPDSPMRVSDDRDKKQDVNPGNRMASAFTPSEIPNVAPLFEAARRIEKCFLCNANGERDDQKGLATNAIRIWDGVEKDIEGMERFLQSNSSTTFEVPRDKSVFLNNIASIRSRLIAIVKQWNVDVASWEAIMDGKMQ